MSISEITGILNENKRRLSIIETPYDPVAGNPRDPNRFHFDVAGLESWIPKEMEREPLVREMIRAGSLDRYIALKATPSDQLRDATLREWKRLRSLYDFPFWAASFAYIKKKGGGEDTLLVLKRPQRKLVNTLERMRRAGKPLRLILLKARQWGGSTCVQLYMAWLQLIHKKGLNSLILAHQGVATDEIKDMFDRMLSQYPAWLLHEPGEDFRDNERRVERVGGSRAAFRVIARNCKVKVGSAEKPDACRGGDYNLVHLSEVGLWRKTALKSPEQIMRAACSGILLHPSTMIVLESTANGTENFFHKEYQAAKKGESQFKALFVAWYEIDDYSLPFSSEAEKLDFAKALYEGRDASQPLSQREQPGSYLWWLWNKGATLEAINWYVKERSKYSDHDLMASEYPSDDVEAFVHSGANVFDKYKVEALRPGCNLVPLRGEIDGDAPFGAGSLCNVRFSEDPNGVLRIWKKPVVEKETRVLNRYLVVVDIGGRSRKADWSVVVVFDRFGMITGGKPEVVAQWRGHTDFDLLAWNAARIATFYDSALLVIESNTLDTRDPARMMEGDQSGFLLNRIRDAYPNLYARRRSEQDILMGAPVKYGFHTNVSTKPMIISMLVQAVREGLYIERDSECLAEFDTYEHRPNGSYAALPGNHDDLLMTRAIGLHICFREMDPPKVVAISRRLPLRQKPVSAAVI
ncbi:MAG: terminase [Bacteroides sp.]|nr:terminase [Bacteroides sp.]